MPTTRQLLAKERASLQDARRVVVKVGTHSIAKPTGRPDYRALRRLVAQLCELRKAGIEVIFVSSGAVAAGVEALGLPARPTQVNDVQMCAAVGQARFISEYERLFESHGVKIGQVLLTHADFDDRRRAANLRRSLDHLVRAGIVPVINENDIVADEELKGLTFGDNDWLSSRDAMKLVHTGQKGALSKGGMDSKLRAVQNAAKAGAHVVIANAATPHVLTSILAGRDIGTFVPGSAL